MSDQVDIIVLKPSYPQKMLNQKYYLSGGVLAAFECKTTLKRSHIKKAFQNAIKIKKLLPKSEGTFYKELNNPILFGLLSHSHRWKQNPIDKIGDIILENNLGVSDPKEIVDIICVSDLATWLSYKNVDPFPIANNPFRTSIGHFPYSFNVEGRNISIAAFIVGLYKKLSWIEPSMRSISDYLQSMQMLGESKTRGRDIYFIYSKSLMNAAKSRIRVEGPSVRVHIDQPWDEFSTYYP